MVGLNPNAKVFNSSLSQTNNENLKQTEINSMGLSELNPNAKEFAFTGGGNVTVYKAKGPKNALQLQFMQSRNHQSERRYSANIIGAPSYALQSQQSFQLHARFYNTSQSSPIYLPFKDCRTIKDAAQMIHYHLHNSTPRNLSAFWSSVPLILKKSRFEKVQNVEQLNHQLNDILGHTLQNINSFGYRDLSTIGISLAKIVKNVRGTIRKRHPRYDTPQRVLHDMIIGDNSSKKEFIFKVLAAPSMIILHKFDSRSLSNLIYAYGLAEYVIKFEDDDRTLFDVFALSAIPNLHTFNGQDLSNMLWSYANVGISNSQLFEQAGDSIVAMNNLHNFYFKPQEISNTIWAYATLDEQHPWLFKKIGNHIVQLNNLDEFKPQALSNIVWAYATVEESHPQIFKKVADHIIALNDLGSFNGQDCSNTVWAYATAEESHPKLFKKMADHIVQLPNLNEFKSQALSNTVWAFAISGESHPQLFNKLADEAIKRQHEFIPQDTSNTVWAYATNGQVDKHFFSSLVPAVKANLDEYTAQGLINVAWAYSVANVDVPSVFNNEFIDTCLMRKEDRFTLKDFTQLHQWQLWQDEIKSDISLPLSLQKRCYEAFISQDPTPSKLQDDVVSILSSIGLQPQEEVLLKSGYRIDAIVEVNGKKIAVEVDGPYHFFGRSRERTGSTILKHRQVATLDGIQVVSVPYWEWNKLKKDSEKKQQYLQHLLGV